MGFGPKGKQTGVSVQPSWLGRWKPGCGSGCYRPLASPSVASTDASRRRRHQMRTDVGKQTCSLSLGGKGLMCSLPAALRVATPFSPPGHTVLLAGLVGWGTVQTQQFAKPWSQDKVEEFRVRDRVDLSLLCGRPGGHRWSGYGRDARGRTAGSSSRLASCAHGVWDRRLSTCHRWTDRCKDAGVGWRDWQPASGCGKVSMAQVL